MINASIHGVTQLTISEPKEKRICHGGAPYYVRTLVAMTQQGENCKIDLFGESAAALTATESTEADYWRTQAAEESARADAAESLVDEWRSKHAELYVASETNRQRADSAEQRLAALQELLHKACDVSGERVGGSVQP